jgi:hypothetical protein
LLAITAHWIDDQWNLNTTLLEFVEFESPHTGKNMSKLVMGTLEYYNLVDKLFCITTDNASNNDTMAKAVSDALVEHGVYWDPDTQHLYCLAHIINLVVKSLLDSLDVENDSPFKATLTKIRELAKAIQLGSKKPASFRNACRELELKHLRIPLDVAVRWNSTYRMIERAIYLRPALDRLITNHFEDLNEYRLTGNEWAIAEQVLMILTPFQRCTTRFECNSRSSEVDYVFFAYDTMFNHLEDVLSALSRSRISTAHYLINAINEALATLRIYYDKTTTMPHVYADAMILNPRVKLSIFNLDSWGDEDANSYRDATRTRFVDDYMNQRFDRSTDGAGQNSIPTDDGLFNEEEDYAEHLRKRFKKVTEKDCEFDRYLSNPNGDNQISDIFAWWRAHSIKYPKLSQMARDYLSVPPSGCAVEREFSVSGRIATWQRNRLSPARISASMMYKSAMKREGRWASDDISQIDESLIEDFVEESDDDNGDGNIPSEWRDNWWKQKITGGSRR